MGIGMVSSWVLVQPPGTEKATPVSESLWCRTDHRSFATFLVQKLLIRHWVVYEHGKPYRTPRLSCKTQRIYFAQQCLCRIYSGFHRVTDKQLAKPTNSYENL